MDDFMPLTEVVELEGGGTLALIRNWDGSYRMRVETDGLSLGVPLTARDVKGIREGTGAMVIADATAVLRSA